MMTSIQSREIDNIIIISSIDLRIPGTDCWSLKLALPSTHSISLRIIVHWNLECSLDVQSWGHLLLTWIKNCLSSDSIWIPSATCFIMFGEKVSFRTALAALPQLPHQKFLGLICLRSCVSIMLTHNENKKYSHRVPSTFTATDNRQLLGRFCIRVQLVMLHIIVLFGFILWTLPCRGTIACWTAILACVTPRATFLGRKSDTTLGENRRKWAT